MTKRARPRSKRPPGKRFIMVEFWELETPAFAHLSADATRLYLFVRKAMNFDASNNGKVPFSHRDAAKILHSGWRRGSNALAELEHYGFIKRRNGGQPGDAIRVACEWQLTAFPCGGQEPSKDFTRWAGAGFERPYVGKLGLATQRSRDSQKQRPIGNVPTPRRQHDDAFAECTESQSPRIPESVGNMPTDSTPRRRQHADTITITREGGPKGRARAPVESWPAQPRRARGLSQYALGKAVGTSRGHIASLEQGLRKPSPATVDAITRALAGRPVTKEPKERRAPPPPKPKHLKPPMPDNAQARLNAGIRAHGWSRRELAALAGTHVPIVGKVCRGDLHKVGPATVIRILDVAETPRTEH
jgi:ribosome-binding protein aMBF1 (putative translation factor)